MGCRRGEGSLFTREAMLSVWKVFGKFVIEGKRLASLYEVVGDKPTAPVRI